jgi:phage shock protein A
MTLLHRIVRLFKADIHGILDVLEEPDVMLKQSIREMREELACSEARHKAVKSQLEHWAQKQQELTEALAELENQIDFCFCANNEILAKNLLRKKLETLKNLKMLEQQRKALEEERSELETELAERHDKLAATLDKMALFTDCHADTDLMPETPTAQNISQEDVEIAFLQEQQRRTTQETQP